jgi:hypothetical protein
VPHPQLVLPLLCPAGMAEIHVERKRSPLGLVLLLVLIAVAAFLAWYFMQGRTTTVQEQPAPPPATQTYHSVSPALLAA